MLSWDNLTSKGYMGAVPDHLLVWSDLMADEAVRYHDFPRERIHWCGAAQFDHYFGLRDRLDRAAWRRAHGVPGDAALIVYGTINPAILPHEIEYPASRSSHAMRSGRFARQAVPLDSLAPASRPRTLQSIARAVPPARRTRRDRRRTAACSPTSWPGTCPRRTPFTWRDLLAAADVVVTPNSTLSIDAACAGTPIVNVFFDGDAKIHPAMSSKRFMSYTHYSHILETGGIAKAMTIDDFVRFVNDYVADPEVHREGREAIIRQQLNRLDGHAGKRAADALLRICGVERATAALAGQRIGDQ